MSSSSSSSNSTHSLTIYYVDPNGNDNNTGTSIETPWQTIQKVNTFAIMPGNTICFKGGSTFIGSLNTKSGIVGYPITYTSYGTGQAIISGGGNIAMTIIDSSYLTINNLSFLCPTTTTFCVFATNTTTNGTKQSGLQITNNTITGGEYSLFFAGPSTTSDGYDGLVITGNILSGGIAGGIYLWESDGSNSGQIHYTNPYIANNIVYGYPGSTPLSFAGIVPSYIYGTHREVYDGVITSGSNVITSSTIAFTSADVGVRVMATGIPYGTRIGSITNSTTAILTTLATASATSAGIMLASAVVEGNYVHDCGSMDGNTSDGPGGIVIDYSNGVVCQYNEIARILSGTFDGIGIDIDEATFNCIVQYNYCYECDGPGAQIYGIEGSSGNTIRWNLLVNNVRDSDGSYPNVGHIRLNYGTNCIVTNNTIIDSINSPGSPGIVITQTDGGIVSNNVIDVFGIGIQYMPNTGTCSWTIQGNVYGSTVGIIAQWAGVGYTTLASFRSATGQENSDSFLLAGHSCSDFYNIPSTLYPSVVTSVSQYRPQPIASLNSNGTNTQINFSISSGPTDINGYAIAQNNLPFGVYTINGTNSTSSSSSGFINNEIISTPKELGENSLLEFGGIGNGNGRFLSIDGLFFDKNNNIYVWDKGNSLVQIFDHLGNFISQTAVMDAISVNVSPTGELYVGRIGSISKYISGVLIWSRYLQLAQYIICYRNNNGQEELIIIPSSGSSLINLLAHNGSVLETITLSIPLINATMCSYVNKTLYILHNTWTLSSFDLFGTLISSIGSSPTNGYAVDGRFKISSFCFSEVKGKLYFLDSNSYLYELGPNGDVYYSLGYFSYGQTWFPAILACDNLGRIWVGSNNSGTHYSPCVLLLYYNGFLELSTYNQYYQIGSVLSVSPVLQYGIQYNLNAVVCNLNYSIKNLITVKWRVDDLFGNLVAHGTENSDSNGILPNITFTPSAYGSYTVACVAYCNLVLIGSSSTLISVVNGGNQLPSSFDDEELEVIAWGNLGLARLDTTEGVTALGNRIAIANTLGLTYCIQFVLESDATPQNCTTFATAFTGQNWEIVNEPTLHPSNGPQYTNDILIPAYHALKNADPTCKVLGPQLVAISPETIDQFINDGGLDYIDIYCTHDYQGNEAIDPLHFSYSFGLIRSALNNAGKNNMQIWQTERAVSSYLGAKLTAAQQAKFLLQHINLLDTYGIPVNHNSYFYANSHGFNQVASWVFGAEGAMPALLMTRQRGILLGNKILTSTIDFGTILNRVFFGLIHSDNTGQILTLFNSGTSDENITLNINQLGSLDTYDCFGNHSVINNIYGNIVVKITTYPSYIKLDVGTIVTVVQEPFGTNLAIGATASCSSATLSGYADISTITSGVIEQPYGDNTSNSVFWGADATNLPVTVEIDLGSSQTISKAIIFSNYADNSHCALLAYDLQYFDGSNWITLDKLDFYIPTCWFGETVAALNGFIQIYPGYNFKIHVFSEVTASKFRIYIRRTTRGQYTDDLSAYSGSNRNINIREFELYA